MTIFSTTRPYPLTDLNLLEDRELDSRRVRLNYHQIRMEVQPKIPLSRRVACVDFDGVIADYGEGFQGVGAYGEPLPGVAGALHRLAADGWRIIVLTARQNAEVPFIQRYLDKHGIPYSKVTTRKPNAHVYVDDRGLRFDGDWKKTLREISEFEPYYHRE